MSKTVNAILAAANRIDGVPRKIVEAQQRALSTTARRARSDMVKAIRAEAPLPARYVSGKVFGRRVGEAAEVGAPKQDRIPIVAYPHAKVPHPSGSRGRGYRVRLTPGAWTSYPSVFTIPNRRTKFGPLLFQRVGKARFPIEAVMGPPVSEYFLAQAPAIAEAGAQFFSLELQRQIKLLNP